MPLYFSPRIGPFSYVKRVGGGSKRSVAWADNVAAYRARKQYIAAMPHWQRVLYRVLLWTLATFLGFVGVIVLITLFG